MLVISSRRKRYGIKAHDEHQIQAIFEISL